MFSRLIIRRSLHTTPRLLSSSPSPSALEVTLRNALKTSMKAKDKPAATCLKSILADVTNSAKSGTNPNEPSSQEGVMTVLRKGIAQRLQAAESYSPSSPSPHAENHASLTSEINLLRSFLPPIPTNESIQSSINKIIASLDSEVRGSKSATGKVLAALWEELGESKAGVDKKEVGKWVQDALKK
ncbi:hypothetical protein CI109_101183 [Kwoniella shandongensis]|uniref:Altered inheritance of mitochondria protein 41 n=1 Tax=Kwoniella shandongensis TaxID=1734106 RepID=A0A5M6BVW1_9TREE|nr:uncharacterized protein CI109_005499 [Kwoniella shandongensis]KAA5526220.1 hypothetical protein CI109_005499 [Kwoniella shandongensis]